MRQFALFINDQVRGPHTEAEIAEMIARGELTAATLCAPAGSTEWEPLSNHFSFGSKLKVNRSRKDNEESSERDGVNVDQRRKLLVYGLADSVTIDQFDFAQAQAMIDAHEGKIRARIKRHRVAGVLGLLCGLALGLYAGLRTSADRPLTAATEQILGTDDKVTAQVRSLDREVMLFERLKVSVAAATFTKPMGGSPATGVLAARLRQDPARGFRTTSTVSLAPLAEKAGQWKASLGTEPKIILLPAAMPQKVAEKVAAQSAALDVVLSPRLQSEKLEELREQVVRSFPELPGNADSDKLRNDARQVKLNGLGPLAARTEALAASAATNSATARWAGELRAFAARVREVQDRNRVNVDLDARRKLWSDHNKGPGSEVVAWVLASGATEVSPGADGSFTLDETPRLDETVAATRILISTRINGDPVLLPWGSPFLILGVLKSEPHTLDHFLRSEKYKIVDKPVAGGRLYAAKQRVGGKELSIERRSPRWHYLSLARDKDPDSIHLLVDEAVFNRHKTGEIMPASEILKGEIFMRPAESVAPAILNPVP